MVGDQVSLFGEGVDLAAQDDRVDVVARTTVLVTDAGDPVAGSNVSVGGRLFHTDGRVAVELPGGG